MIKKTCPGRELERMRGGEGIVHATDFVTLEETHGHVRLFGRFVLEPGCSIGYHTHEEDTEIFYILSGAPTVNDNGMEAILEPGQVMITGNGAGHGMSNPTEETVEFIAMIVNR